tara:strand:- start:118 stop:501 length:384 start_codon:yes stop_codon:yes gene_type:complete
MDCQSIRDITRFIQFKYNIIIDKDILEKLNIKILSRKGGKERFNDINDFCIAVFGIDFWSLLNLSSQDDWIKNQDGKCSITQQLQKRIIQLEKEINEKVNELENEIENLKLTNEELRTSYWNLKHNI